MRTKMRVLRIVMVFSSMIIIPVFVMMMAGCGGVVDAPTSDTEPPTVTSTDPADSATGVILDSTISATFSEPMEPNTINEFSFLVEDRDAKAAISGVVTYSEIDMTATFTSDSPLSNDVNYRVTLTTDMTDVVGNPLKVVPPDVDFNWDFKTIP